MLFPFPDDETLYRALIDRDPSFEGRAFVGVSTTGVFCCLGCPAKKPKRENCQFFETAAACLKAGYRACKRCHPLRPGLAADPLVRSLMDELEAEPGKRWTESMVRERGHDPATVRRIFRRHFGTTFLDLARLYRQREGFRAISESAPEIKAQFDAGFDSSSDLQAALVRLLGQPPPELARGEGLWCDWIQTPLGAMISVADQERLHLLEFADRRALPTELRKLQRFARGRIGIGRPDPIESVSGELKSFFEGQSACFQTPLALHGTAFARSVWEELQQIPAGETRSYRDLAYALGRPSAVRAVANANGQNQIAILIPCHRVIGADGSMVGYGGGLWRKQKLIQLEKGYS